MSITSPETSVSPSREQSENRNPSGRTSMSLPGELPARERVRSASQIPSSQFRPSTSLEHMSSYTPSPRLLENYQTWTEHLRQIHAEERALWALQREELEKKVEDQQSIICQLRAAKDYPSISPAVSLDEARSFVQQSRSASGSGTLSPKDLPNFIQQMRSGSRQATKSPAELGSPPKGTFGSFSAKQAPHAASLDAASNEHRKGSGISANFPTLRHYSESTNLARLPRYLPGISEQPDMTSEKSVGFDITRPLSPPNSGSRIAPIPGDSIDANLDGISFKPPRGQPPSLFKSVVTPHSPSPSPTHSSVSPRARSPPPAPPPENVPRAEPKPVVLALPRASFSEPDELLTAHAGHTPLSRINDDASDASTPKLLVAAPAVEDSTEVPPPEPRPSEAPTARPPIERADSYFPALPPTNEEKRENDDRDDDPALKPPLSLPSDAQPGSPERGGFLSSLNSKLLQAQRSRSEEELAESSRAGTGSAAAREASASASSSADARSGSEDDSDEPKLKIKRSMNFGSQFGTLR